MAVSDGSGVVDLPPSQVSPKAVVLAGLAIGAVIALATSIGDDAEERRTQELARLAPVPADDVAIRADAGNGSGAATDDVSLVATRLADTTSEVDAR